MEATGTINWTLKGDSPTVYFFAIANGRRRRCSIDSLVIDGVRVVVPRLILEHVLNFSFGLLTTKTAFGFIISPNLWDQDRRVLDEENAALLIPLSMEEIEMAIYSPT